LAGGYYACDTRDGGSQNVGLVSTSVVTFGGGADSVGSYFSSCLQPGDGVIRVSGGINSDNLVYLYAAGPWPCAYSFDGCFEGGLDVAIQGQDIFFHPGVAQTFRETVTWTADVGVTASGNMGCDPTGVLFAGIMAPCDFAALADAYPPDQYPQLYTLYDFGAAGSGDGTATVDVSADGRVIDVSYELSRVPEPSTLLLLATAAGIARLVRRSRRMA